MKKIMYFTVLAIFAVACTSNENKQEENESVVADQAAVEQVAEVVETPMAGAYSEMRDFTAEEKAMFDKAVAEFGSEDEITLIPLKVSTQVVAGTNYKFLCDIKDETRGQCEIFIFAPLPNENKEPYMTAMNVLKK